jgi:hydrogenase maturation protease
VAQTADTLVLALGNPLRGDDGVGAATLEALSRHDLPEGVDLVDGGTGGLETVLLFQDYRRVIIIDAAEMGIEPGKWRRFTRDEVIFQSGDQVMRSTIHDAGLAEALQLANALTITPDELVIYGVQPLEVGWVSGLSEPIWEAVPDIIAAVLNELNNN